jgi:hypothetical protein
MFGLDIPAYGFWLRHADRISFDDVRINTLKADARPEFDEGGDAEDILLNGSLLRP